MDHRLFVYLSLLVVTLGLILLPSVSTFAPSAAQYSNLKCHPVLTIDVSGELTRGGLHAYGYFFPDGYFQQINRTHYRVCICSVTKCFRKCCKRNQAYINRSCADGFDFAVHPNIYNQNLQQIYNYDYSHFVYTYGFTCDEHFVLFPENDIADTFYFLENGSLYIPEDIQQLQNINEFCFENFVNKTRTVLRAFLCVPHIEDDPVPQLLPIGMMISTPFLLATFLVYSLPELRNLHGKNLMSHVGSLFFAYIFLLIVQFANSSLSNELCLACGYIIQFTFLASFFWLNIMSFDIWWAFSGFSSLKGEKKTTDIKKYLIYCLYGWCCPAVIVIVTVIMQFAPGISDKLIKPDIGVTSCFLYRDLTRLIYFYGPCAIVLLLDILFFVLTAVKIMTVKKQTIAVFKGKDSRRNKEASKQRFLLYLKLFLIMGITWIMEIISFFVRGPKWIWYLTDLTNTLQGVLVFTLFVLTARIKTVIYNRLSSQSLKSLVSRDSCKKSSKLHDISVEKYTSKGLNLDES